MTNEFFEGGLTNDAFDRAEQAGRIHELEARIELAANDPEAAKVQAIEQQLADQRELEASEARKAEGRIEADQDDVAGIISELRKIQGM